MAVSTRRKLVTRGLTILLATAVLLAWIESQSWPAWARAWRSAAFGAAGKGGTPVMSPADLLRLEPDWFHGAPAAAGLLWSQALKPTSRSYRQQIFAGVRETETRQRQEALADWSNYLDDMVAKRLSEARLSWDERLRDLAIKLGEDSDRQLTQYAAEVRREFFPTVSSLEMQITLCQDEAERGTLEAKLRETLALIDLKIAKKREELSQQCAQELASMRQQADSELASLADTLKAEAQTALANFKASQETAFAAWLREHNSLEQSANQSRN